ncbi:hypothetical protein QQF64_023754 [Cirrhinus molitorella]|uniref:Uncharacterized protein n=1 Tax=Cirrhinus molitorella TaxID=172907 RepID=A0ABR3NJW0_9TELE
MAFIKEENEDIRIAEVFSLKQEDTEDQTDSCDGTKDDTVGGRKRWNESGWKKSVNKRRRMMGQPYVGMRRNEEVNMEPRVMGPRCRSIGCVKSSKHHCSTIEEADREKIFKCFWENMNWEEKKKYVRGLVDVIPVMRRRGCENSRRLSTLVYFLKVDGQRRRVCKSFFLATLGIGEWSALNWVQDTDNTQNAAAHLRRDDREFMKSFLQDLPKVTLCYCGSSASKQYLEPVFQSMTDLYRVYHRAAEEKMLRPFSRQVFSEEFKEQNLGLYHPKKHRCNICSSLNTGYFPDNECQLHFPKKEEACVVNIEDKNDLSTFV